jgi:hypothetical protein
VAIIDSVGIVLRPNGEAFNAGIGQPDIGQFTDGEEVLGPCFAAALLRSDALDPHAVGPLDERYHLYYEDVDWVLRSRRHGWRTLAVTSAVVHHRHAASTRRLGEARRYGLVQRNLLLCVAKNLPLRDVVRIWWARVVVHVKGTITGPYRWPRWRALAGAVLRLPAALAARRADPPLADPERVFAFAEGMEPFFDVERYAASADPAARRAAERRLAERRTKGAAA